MKPLLDEVNDWVRKAKNDLLSARILLEHDPPVLDTACFHCQQGIEKILKAFLVWRKISFEKVHSLTYLLDLCEAEEPQFTSLRDQAEALAPYAVEARYPGDIIEISCEKAQEDLTAAETVWEFVLDFLPNGNGAMPHKKDVP